MNRKIALIVTKRKLGEPSGDVQYWRSRSYEERLQALEEIRQEYHQWMGDGQVGFQRIYRIVKMQVGQKP